MFVAVSWISFLMEMGGGERAGLLVTLFLVLVSMFLSVVTEAPKASFVTAKEIWMMVCMLFVFLAIAEYGTILVLPKKSAKKKLTPDDEKKTDEKTDKKKKKKKNNEKHFLDKIAIAVLPVLFLFFNIVYWAYYITAN